MACCIPPPTTKEEEILKAPQQWSSGLCDCCDCGRHGITCFMSCCLPSISVPQIYQRVTKQKGSCRLYAIILTSIFLLLAVLNSTNSVLAYGFMAAMPTASTWAGEAQKSTAALVLTNVAYWLSMVLSVMMLLLICQARRAVRERDNIPETSCCKCCCGEDCCMAFWCGPCTECQLFRHEEVTNDIYRICSATATGESDLFDNV